jgi:regulator of protease activity HflC (stomatin/prohibitin superfamily)
MDLEQWRENHGQLHICTCVRDSAVGGGIVAPLSTINPVLAVVVGIVWLIADAITSSAIQLAAQWQRAVVFRLGKFKDIRGPGLLFIIPVIEAHVERDTKGWGLDVTGLRIQDVDMPEELNQRLTRLHMRIDDPVQQAVRRHQLQAAR